MILGSDEAAVGRLRRLIALLDQPRPQITLQLWTLQVSDRNSQVIEHKFEGSRRLIRLHDETLRHIYATAWEKLSEIVPPDDPANQSEFFDPEVWSYVTRLYGSRYEDGKVLGCREPDPYCLGYDLSLEGAPSLSRMLIILALSNDPWGNAEKVLGTLKLSSRLETERKALEKCGKRQKSRACLEPLTGLSLERTQEELKHLLHNDGPLRSFRAAILDYLFHYKWSRSYPERFSAYNLPRSAGRVNALFSPVIEAFNTDVQVFVESMQGHPLWPTAPKPEGSVAGLKKIFLDRELTLEGIVAAGRVKVVSLSGSPSKVKGDTISYFDMTPPPNFIVPESGSQADSTADDGGDSTQAAGAGGLGSVLAQIGLPGPFTAGTVTAALRALQAPKPVTVQLNRGLSLDVTAYSLAEASAAELSLKLTVSQEDPSKIGEGSDNAPLLDRIANAELETTVRVPGARLFEVSNFALDVQAPRPDGIFPIVGHAWNSVFGQVPVLNRFFKWRREPATVYHRNLVVVSAIIAPTAADLSLGLRFHRDVLGRQARTDAAIAGRCLDNLLVEHQRKIHTVLGLTVSGSRESEIDKYCRPSELPTLDSVTPAQGAKGETEPAEIAVVLAGGNFIEGETEVLFDGNVQDAVTRRSASELAVTLTLGTDAAEGPHSYYSY